MGRQFIHSAAVACALLVASTACGGADKPPAPTSPPELGVAEYQQKLTGLVDALRPVTEQLNPATTLDQVNQVRAQLGAAVRAQQTELGKLVPPKAAAVAHRSLTGQLHSAGKDLGSPVTAPGDNSCGLPVPAPLALHQAKVVTRKTLDNLPVRQLPEQFAAAGVQFAGVPAPPEPAKPELETRRPGNGTVLQRGSGGSVTGVVANNDGKLDAVVSAVVGGDPSRPRVSVFVRAGESANLTGLSGSYELFYKFGTDLDPQRRGFTRDCDFRKLREPFDGQGNWSLAVREDDRMTVPVMTLTRTGASQYRTATVLKADPF
ncbi:hypothetical protein JOF53_008367 [Crossiella equi]|uniref:Lipoprotein n=1 Tax=Crossiella equi TaxID=130796 RepID=A0ABS5ASF4_9PSEU|nr:hypothetical protein [Crossiella equi]MBP2479495.1 hypothetical protein [Crossiella equi]